jgi:hypothetical protein
MAMLRRHRGERSTAEGGSYSKALTGIGHRVNPAEELGPDAGERPKGGGPGQLPEEPKKRPRPNPGKKRGLGGVRSPLS